MSERKRKYRAGWKTWAVGILLGSAAFAPVRSLPRRMPAPQSVERAARGEEKRAESRYEGEFEKVWKTVRDHFYDPKLHGVDWTRVRDRYREALPKVGSKEEFAALINRMLDELKASHTAYFTDDEIEFTMLPAVMEGDLRGRQVAHIGVTGRRIGTDFLVTAVLDGSPAEKAGILTGDHLLTVEGQPFSTAGAFRGKEGRPVEVVLTRAGETQPRRVMVTPVKENILYAFLEATKQSARVMTVNGKRLGYIHLWTMAHDSFRTTLDQLILSKLADTDGLILDLRDGYGGMPWKYADVFFRPDVAWEQQAGRSKPTALHTGYDRPMVVLINEGTRSAKEFLAYQMKTSHRATLVGNRTAGAFLGAGMFKISENGLLELAVVGLKLDHARLEGQGVAPDVSARPAFAYTERDQQMATAQRTLLDLIQRGTHPSARHEAVIAP